ncbi:ATP:cob(I)alamin adenosyltransferase [bacterium]|nr:ATP:cob(I)alamin adenosyltransferase [bacterium]
MKIYTKNGDDGTTSLRDGKRISKNSLRIDTYGDIDELSSFIGLAASFSRNKNLKTILLDIQHDLFILASDTNFDEEKVKKLELIIDEFSASLKPLNHFILPGGTKLAGHLHAARTICRRAERTAVALSENEGLHKNVIPYLNRLSDLLFTLARSANKGKDIIA